MTDWLREVDCDDAMINLDKCLNHCGIEFNSSSYTQLKPSSVFVSALKELLRKGSILTFQQFKDTLTDVVNIKEAFHNLLLPMMTSFDQYTFKKPKSLFQLLLSISELSSFLIDILIEKICELCETDNAENNELAIMCLNQLQWCSNVCRTGDIIDRLLDLGYVSSGTIKKHIISILPTVCYGRCSDVIATKLFDWMISDNALIACCLDTINQLDLDDVFKHDIELLIIELLDTAVMQTLPSMIVFLIKCADKNNVIILVDKIRSNVSFDNLQTMFSSAISSTPLEDRYQSCALNMINAIRINFQFNNGLQKSWLKSMTGGPDKVRCQSFDLIVLLVMYDHEEKSGAIISLFRSKVCKRLFTDDTVEAVFKYHLSVVKAHYRILIKIVNSILSGNDAMCCNFAKKVYEQCFMYEDDNFTRKDMIEILLTEIAVKSKNTIDNNVAILQFLSEKFTSHMRLFYTQICEMLTLGCRFSNSQIYDIFRIVGTLAFNGDESDLEDIKQDITSVIRRQLNNPNLFVRRNGVIGAITIMRQLANCELSETWSVGAWTKMLSSQSDSESEIVSLYSDDRSINANERMVSTVLRLLMSTSDVQPQLCIVIFDELYRLIALDEMTSVQMEIRKIITSHFTDNYICDIDSRAADYRPLFGLLGTDYCDVAVTISQSKEDIESVNVSLPAQFRLLALCETKTQNKNLKDINALLGCPIGLATKVEQISSLEQVTVINWFIELVNAFSVDFVNNDNGIFLSTYVLRLKEIVSQVKDFERKLATQQKLVKLPPIQITEAVTVLPVTEIKTFAAKKRGSKPSKKKSKKAKTDGPNETVADDLFGDDDFEVDADIAVVPDTKCKVLRENLSLCYRELDLSVFAIMAELVASDLILSDVGSVSLDWVELDYYCTDMWLKVTHRLKIVSLHIDGVMNQKNSSMYRYVERISLEDFLEQLVKMAQLFKKVLAMSINICKNKEVLEGSNSSCFRVMNLTLKIVSHLVNFLLTHKTERNEDLLGQLISSLLSSSSNTITDDINELLRDLLTAKNCLPNIMVVSSYCILIQNLLQYPTMKEHNSNVSLLQLTSEFLGRKWEIGGDFSLADFKSSVSTLFEIHLNALDNDWFKVLQSDILPEMVAVAKNENPGCTIAEVKYGCLNRSTLFGLFKLVLDSIIKKCKSLSKTSNSQRNRLEVLQAWDKPINIVKSLTNVVANHDEGNTMFCFIKFSRDIMKVIIKDLMPILDNMLRHEDVEVIQLLKNIQDVTRFIQRVCIHCKGKKNLPVTSLVPQVRRYLETFMYRVKKMMCINKCTAESLNILPLANKDLHGHRIETDFADEDQESEDNVDVDSNCQESDNETVLDE